MAKPPKTEPPKDQPVVPPSELYANYDIRIVMMKLGEIGAQVADLREGLKDIENKQGEVEKKLASFETTIRVGGVLIALFLAFFWFMFGGDIAALRDLAIQNRVAN